MVGNGGNMQTETMPCHLKIFSSAMQLNWLVTWAGRPQQ